VFFQPENFKHTVPMGADQSVIGLRMMEAVYPGQGSIFTNDKLKAVLEKELKKRKQTLDDFERDEQALDGDLDAEVDRFWEKVFVVYDKKAKGSLEKKSG